MRKSSLILLFCAISIICANGEALTKFTSNGFTYYVALENTDPLTRIIYDELKPIVTAEPILPQEGELVDVVVEPKVTYASIEFHVRTVTIKDNEDCLRSLVLKPGITEIHGTNNCKNLERIELPNTMVRISGLNNLPSLEVLEIPEQIAIDGLKVNDESLTNIGVKTLTLPENMWFCHSSLKGLGNLVELNFSNSIGTGENCIGGMPALKTLRLPREQGFIGAGCFGIMGIEELYMPESEDLIISSYAFYALPYLRTIYCPSSVPPEIVDIFEYPGAEFGTMPHDTRPVDKKKCRLLVPPGCVDAYRNSIGWGGFSNIEEYDFDGAEKILTDNNTEDAATVYYDLNGRVVENPTSGLYIAVTGSKVSKQIVP